MDVSISILVSLRITGSKYKTESFKPLVFGSNFLFHSITSSDTSPVKIKTNTTVRILLGFLSLTRAAPKHAEPTMISRLIPTDLSEAKTLSCMLFHTPGEWFHMQRSSLTYILLKIRVLRCLFFTHLNRGLLTVSTFLHYVSKAKKYCYPAHTRQVQDSGL